MGIDVERGVVLTVPTDCPGDGHGYLTTCLNTLESRDWFFCLPLRPGPPDLLPGFVLRPLPPDILPWQSVMPLALDTTDLHSSLSPACATFYSLRRACWGVIVFQFLSFVLFPLVSVFVEWLEFPLLGQLAYRFFEPLTQTTSLWLSGLRHLAPCGSRSFSSSRVPIVRRLGTDRR